MPQDFWVPDPQPELLALPRDALCKASEPQTLRVSLRGIASRLFISVIVSPERFFGFRPRAMSLPMSLIRALPFSLAPVWIQTWIFMNLGFFQRVSFLKHFCFLQRKWHLAPFLSPTFRDTECYIFCVRLRQRYCIGRLNFHINLMFVLDWNWLDLRSC